MTVDTKAIEKVITIAARPETVFRLLTDPSLPARRPKVVDHIDYRDSRDYEEDRLAGEDGD